MSTRKFEHLAARVKQAAGGGPGLTERLKHAQDVVKRQPTGFDEPIEQALTIDVQAVLTHKSEGEERRKIYFGRVPIDLVDPNPFNARRIYRPERINDLATSIAASGQLIPGIATIREERYVLVAGHYRWRAIKVAGLHTMNLMIHEGLTDQELYHISFKENDERTQQSPLDNALAWRDLIDRGIYQNESAIAEVTGQSLANVNKTISILRLSEPVLEMVRQRPENYALSALYELVLLEQAAGKDAALAIAAKVGAGEIGRKEVAEQRAKFESYKERKPKENSRQYKIRIDGLQIGFIKEWDSGKVALEVSLVDPKAREALVEELKRRFHLEST